MCTTIARHHRHLRRVFAPCTYSLFFIISIVIVLNIPIGFFFHLRFPQPCDGYSVFAFDCCPLGAFDNSQTKIYDIERKKKKKTHQHRERERESNTRIASIEYSVLLITKFSTYWIRIEETLKRFSIDAHELITFTRNFYALKLISNPKHTMYFF